MAETADNGRYYVYGLVDSAARRQTKDDLLSSFHVGKGSGDRWQHHQRDELRDLRREMNLVSKPCWTRAVRRRFRRDRGLTRLSYSVSQILIISAGMGTTS